MEFITAQLSIFRIYQFCGFAPFSMPSNSKKVHFNFKESQNIFNNKWIIYNGFLLCSLGVFVVFNFVFADEQIKDDADSKMLNYFGFIITSCMRILPVLIVVESLWNQRQQIQLLICLDNVDKIFFDKLDHKIKYAKMSKQTYSWMIFWLVKLFVLQVAVSTLYSRLTQNIGMMILFFLYTVPLLVSSIRYFQIIHYIQLIGYRFESMKSHLEQMCRTAKVWNTTNVISLSLGHFDIKSINEMSKEIILLREIYNCLWEATSYVNFTFRWSLLLSIGSSFVIVVANYYRTLVWLLTPKAGDGDEVILFLAWSIYHTIYLVKLSSACYDVSQEVCFVYCIIMK